MALQKQRVNVNFTDGFDAGIDAKLLRPGKLQTLQNGAFTGGGVIQRRDGIATLSPTATIIAPPSTGVRLDTYDDQLLIEGVGGVINNYNDPFAGAPALFTDATVGSYILKRVNRASLETEFIALKEKTRTPQGTEADVAYTGPSDHRACWVWSDGTTSGIQVLIRDENTGNTISRFSVAATGGPAVGRAPRVVYVESADKFYVYYIVESLNELQFFYIDNGNPTLLGVGGTSSYIVPIAAASMFDVCYDPSDEKLAIAYVEPLGDLYMALLDEADGFTVENSGTVTPTTLVRGLSVLADNSGGTNYQICAWADGNTTLTTSTATFDSSAVITTRTRATGHTIGNIDTCTNPADATKYSIVYEQKNTNPNCHIEVVNTLIAGEALPAESDVVGGCRLVGKCIANTADTRTYVPIQYNDSLQPTIYLVDLYTLPNASAGPAGVTSFITSSGRCPPVLARIFPESSAGIVSNLQYRLPSSYQPDISNFRRKYVFPVYAFKELEQSGGGTYFRDTYLAKVSVDFSGHINSVNLSPGLYLSGACPMYYDGTSLVEAEFNHAPTISSVAAGTTGSITNASDQTYSVLLVFAWRDACGRLHRSAPSKAFNVTLVAASGHDSITINYYDQLLTQKNGVSLEVYRTTVGSDIYKKDPHAVPGTGSVVLTAADTDLGEALYTEGGTPAYVASSQYGQCVLHQGRVIAVDPSRASLYFSDPDQEDQPPAFSPDAKLLLPGDRGKITALASMDERLLIFCERGIYTITGEGPSLSLTGGSYSDPILVEDKLGCIEGASNSVVRDPEGLWFMSSEGIRHLNRGLSISRLEDGRLWGSETAFLACIRALSVPGKTQLRFFDGTYQWVYDYRFRQWSQFTNFSAVGAAVLPSGIVYHQNNTAGQIRYENAGATIDSGSSRYSMYLETGYFKLTGIQDFMRLYRVFLLGDTGGSVSGKTQTLNVSMTVDYGTSAGTKTFDFATAFTSGLVQAEIHAAVQKCQAVKFEISDTSASGNQLNYKLVNLTLEVGVKRGGPKLPVAQKA